MSRTSSVIGSMGLCLVTLIVIDGLLRFIPSPIQSPSLHVQGEADSLLGIRMLPNATEVNHWSCHTWTMKTNSAGWRDAERSVARTPGKVRIAVLGDSFTEGLGVDDSETYTRQLEQLLGPDVEVLNFGISSIGTVQEDILYQYVVSTYKPDIVLLQFYNNDVYNSNPSLDGGPSKNTRLTYRDGSGGLMSYRTPVFLGGVRSWFREHSALYRLITYVVATVISHPQTSALTGSGTVQTGYPLEFDVYKKPPSGEWITGWNAVETSLTHMRDSIEPTGKFFVFSAPDILEIDDHPADILSKQFDSAPNPMDALYPRTHLTEIAAQDHIQMIDLLQPFRDYKQAHALPFPYFAYTCNGHWSALGHTLAAETLARQIAPIVENLRAAHP